MKFKFVFPPLLLAHWPVLNWYISRVNDTSDDMSALIPLSILILYVIRRPSLEPLTGKATTIIFLIMFLYTISYHHVLPMIRAMLFALSLAIVISFSVRKRLFDFGIYGLAFLSLPIIPSLQFYLGYPLRYAITFFSSIFLRISGYHVQQEGVSLTFAGKSILVDAPCSGINMLWSGILFFCIMHMILDLNRKNTPLLIFYSIFFILAGNLMRSMALFFTELKIIDLPEWTHTSIGILVFIAVLASIYLMTSLVDHKEKCKATPSYSS